MRPSLCVFASVAVSLLAVPAMPGAVVDPPEVAAAREAFETALAPIREKINAAIAERAKPYTVALQALETQLAGAGKADAIAIVRAEREAYASGRGTPGFVAKDKAVPAAAKELRRLYDRDVTKIHTDQIPASKSAGAAFQRQIEDLERKYTAARDADGLLAVRRQKQAMQGAAADPLAWGDGAAVGKWHESGNFVFDLHPDYTVTTTRNPKGVWYWDDRAHGKLTVKFDNWVNSPSYEITPDGWGMNGGTSKGEVPRLTREK